MTDHQPSPVQPYQTPPEVKEARRPMRYRTAKLVALILILFGGGLFAYRATRVMRNDYNLNRTPVDPDRDSFNTRYPPPPEPMPEELESARIQGQAIDAVGLESASDLRSIGVESASGEPLP